MEGCVFWMMILGVGATDAPVEIEAWNCKQEVRYLLDEKEVYVYDRIETNDEDLFIYSEMR